MTTSNLHYRLINFAKGMPAFAFSYKEMIREIDELKKNLEGSYPDRPVTSMGDIPLPVYGLAYSGFVSDIKVSRNQNFMELDAEIRATIHLRGLPTERIREYVVKTVNPIRLVLDYDQASRKLFWREQGSATTDMSGVWAANADAVLSQTQLPDPKRDSFLKEVELPSIWTTQNMFVSLLIALLPFYQTSELADWLTLLDPLRFDYDSDHILVTAPRATMAIGGCDPTTVTVEEDPSFPYGQAIPAPTFAADEVAFAVYLPRTRLVDFTAKALEPAVLVNSGGGGFVKWSVSGAFGLKRLTADISTGFKVGDNSLSVLGLVELSAAIDFVGGARAWIDGPSGLKLSLASASVLGSGVFVSDFRFYVNLGAGTVYADVKIKSAELTSVDFDVNTPLGWPIDDVAGEILDRVARHEIKKLAGQVQKLGQWDFMGIPFALLDSLGNYETVAPVIEGLSGVSTYTGLLRRNIG